MAGLDLETVHIVAPVRADLSAGFTDVQPFCRDRPGYVVNVALGLGVHVRMRRSPAPGPYVVPQPLPQFLVSWTARELGFRDRFEITVVTPGLTPGSGLGASGALSVAVAYAMLRWGNEGRTAPPGPDDVVALSVRAERAAGVTGGTQDQWASAHGGWGTVCQRAERGERVALPAPTSLAEHLMLVHPGGTRDSGAIVRAVTAEAEFARSGSVIEAMNSTALQLEKGLRMDDVVTVAGLVDESRALLARLNARIVSRSMQELLRRAPGVLGAKPCGAGGDSAVWLAIVEPDARDAFAKFVCRHGPSATRVEPSTAGVREHREPVH